MASTSSRATSPTSASRPGSTSASSTRTSWRVAERAGLDTLTSGLARDERVIAELQARGRFGIRLGLGRTRALLRALGDPHVGLRGVLIGGTNGKGSVQELVAQMLRAGGYRVGQTPKPHLVEYRERIVVDGTPISPGDLSAIVEEILAVADRISPRLGPPTEFELLTAAAFTWFARCGVEVAVIEVGLGGRLDATNVWDGGVAAITNVGMDHADRLGGSLESIAREKAAILKRGDRAVTAATDAALSIIRRRARRMAVPLVEVAALPVLGMDRTGIALADDRLGEVRLPLLGRHQAANAAVALACIDALEAVGAARVRPRDRRIGLARARWPGRLEAIVVPDAPHPVDVLLDGAHNADGVAAFVEALRELRPHLAPGATVVVIGLMSDKDVGAILGRLAADPLIRSARIIATRVADQRALPAADLAGAWRAQDPAVKIEAVAPPEVALDRALEIAGAAGGTVAVIGSLYLVGACRAVLVRRGVLPPLPGGRPYAARAGGMRREDLS